MKKILRLGFTLIMLLTLTVSSVAYAQDEGPSAPEGVNTFTVSPDPAPAGTSVTVDINANMTAGTGGATLFCLYIPTTAATADGDSDGNPDNTPTPFNLLYYSSFTQYTAAFAKATNTAPVCPVRTGQTSTLYAVTSGLPTGDTTYEGSANMTINSSATAGTYNWTLLLQEPGSGVNPLSYSHEIQAAVTDVYASDKTNCGGYSPCYHSLQSAVTAVTGTNDVIIVGTLTGDTAGTTLTGHNVTTIRGIETPVLNVNSGCTTAVIHVDKAGVTVKNITIDGSAAPSYTGIDVTATGATLDNLTVQNFSAGTGIKFSTAGAGIVKKCTNTIKNNLVGVEDASSGIVQIGSGPNDGNTFTGNTTGIKSDGGTTDIKGNTITGGTNGIELTANVTGIYDVYGNSITGFSTNGVYCNGATAGAAWNYLGGNAPDSGSNCTSDRENQLGASIAGWADGTSYGAASTTAGGGPVFQLSGGAYGADAPGTVYAVKGGTITVSGSGTQYKMYMDGTDDDGTTQVCFPITESECWESTGNSRSQDGPGYFSNGSTDPTAIMLADFTATTSSASPWLPVVLVVGALAVVSGGFVVVRRKRS